MGPRKSQKTSKKSAKKTVGHSMPSFFAVKIKFAARDPTPDLGNGQTDYPALAVFNFDRPIFPVRGSKSKICFGPTDCMEWPATAKSWYEIAIKILHRPVFVSSKSAHRFAGNFQKTSKKGLRYKFTNKPYIPLSRGQGEISSHYASRRFAPPRFARFYLTLV